MKCNLYNSIMWMACLIMASCSKQELIEQVSKPVHSNTLCVVTEKQVSRSVLNYEGNFYWTENDYIGVYGSETENARFYLNSQGDGISTFTGNMNFSNEAVKWAYFPYSQEVKVNQQQLTFPISAERTISNENHSPMIGRVESDNTVRFYHTGGILYLKVVGLPEYATQLVITSEGENAPYLAGTAVIDDRYEDGCTYYIENGSREIVYDVQSLNKDEYFHYIYVPLQVGNYEKIRVAIRNEKGGTIKERTLSDLIVERARMTETPVLNFSEKLYGYQLPEDWLVETQWDEAMLFSNELFIACDNESEETRRFFISNVMDWGSSNAKALQVVMDAEGNVLNMTTDSFSAYFSNRKGDYVDITLMLDNNIETFANQYIPSRSAQGRAGVGEGSLSAVIGVVDYCSGVKKIMSPDKWDLGATEIGLQAVSVLANNKAVEIVVGIAGEAMSGAVEGAVGGLIVGSVGGPAGALSGAVTGAGVGAVKGLIVGTIKVVAEELDNKNNERIYEKFCGQAQIVLGEPIQINNEMFSIEYSLRNSQSVPDAYKLRGTCGLLVKEFSNYDILNQSAGRISYGVLGAKSYGERNLSSDWTHVQNISFRKGYTYLMVAYVTAFDVTDENVLNTLNPICYYSDVKKITFHNSSLENVKVAPNNPMAYANNNFHTTVRADVQCDAKNWKVCIMRGENTYMEQSYSGNTPQSVVFNLEIPALLYFNLTKMNDKDDVIKPYDKWRISVVAMNENGTTSSQSKNLNFVYDTPSSIKIISAKKIATQKVSSSSSRAADDEGTYYQTTYEITVQVKGAPRFKYFQVRSSKGNLYTGNIKPHEDGTYVYEGTIVYEEDDTPDYIDIEGYAFYCGGHFEEFGATVRCIGSPIESCEIR